MRRGRRGVWNRRRAARLAAVWLREGSLADWKLRGHRVSNSLQELLEGKSTWIVGGDGGVADSSQSGLTNCDRGRRNSLNVNRLLECWPQGLVHVSRKCSF